MTVDAGVSYIRQRMQETLYIRQRNARDSISDNGIYHIFQNSFCAGVSISGSGCRSLYIRQRMQETISDSGCKRRELKFVTIDILSDIGCKSLYIIKTGCKRQMQETLYQTMDAGVSISGSGCRSLYIRQRMQETISDSGCKRLYQTSDARVSILKT